MPVQDLGRTDARRRWFLPTTPRLILARRLAVAAATAAITVVGAVEMHAVLAVGGLTGLEAIVLALYVALIAWIALPATTALAGLLVGLRRRPALGIDPASPLPTLTGRVALLMPSYNEPPARVFAAIEAMMEEIAATGNAGHFDVFVLSDTTDAPTWLAEESAFLALRRRAGLPAIYYRRRARNTDRKAGNIAEWVGRFGAAYPAMIVLDADSLMTGDALVRLAAAMERTPRSGSYRRCPSSSAGGPCSPAASSSPALSTARFSPAASPGGTAARATTGATTPSSAPPPSPRRPGCRTSPAGRPSAAISSATTSSRRH